MNCKKLVKEIMEKADIKIYRKSAAEDKCTCAIVGVSPYEKLSQCDKCYNCHKSASEVGGEIEKLKDELNSCYKEVGELRKELEEARGEYARGVKYGMGACKKGHNNPTKNTYGIKVCKTCRAANQKKYRARRGK